MIFYNLFKKSFCAFGCLIVFTYILNWFTPFCYVFVKLFVNSLFLSSFWCLCWNGYLPICFFTTPILVEIFQSFYIYILFAVLSLLYSVVISFPDLGCSLIIIHTVLFIFLSPPRFLLEIRVIIQQKSRGDRNMNNTVLTPLLRIWLLKPDKLTQL